MLIDYFWWRNPVPSGGSAQAATGASGVSGRTGISHPWIHIRKEIPEPEVEQVETVVAEAVASVIDERALPNPQVDSWKIEREFRKWLDQQKQQWKQEYAALIAYEYAKREQEIEEAQIAMLLFDM